MVGICHLCYIHQVVTQLAYLCRGYSLSGSHDLLPKAVIQHVLCTELLLQEEQ